ncbi:uncharacterized protein PRCAT00002482001 [Priceomyces carsonii]|uniref:uncharacterized protein n=1 Tax=Priceomyces carsonii TaxID=28549 RepID=UPI002EDA6D3E|nr:unnamed protein product [Priceomyces carsonii]
MVKIGTWNPDKVTLTDDSVPDSFKYCVLQGVYGPDSGNDYNGSLGARISSVFVILFVSTAFTMFPLVAKRIKALKIPLYVYLFARYFGTGVIVATAYVHLMDPAYAEIGGNSCVGMTGNWAIYAWPPALMLLSIFSTFLVDMVSQAYVERKFGILHSHADQNSIEDAIIIEKSQHQDLLGNTLEKDLENDVPKLNKENKSPDADVEDYNSVAETDAEYDFSYQFSAFLILELGVIFHSVMIGLNLGAVGDEFKTLYIVLVFHQSFEGLGIGARLSAIPIPDTKPKWLPWVCCLVYGLVTPICVAIGLGVRTAYNSNSYAANVVLGVLDSLSAGVLMYTGLIELIARDFIFNPSASHDLYRLTFLIFCMLLGAGIMALLGKWA